MLYDSMGQLMSKTRKVTYLDAGVDTEAEDVALNRLTDRVRQTWPRAEGFGSVQLDIGFFANVVDIGGVGLAVTTDGVGTKALVAQMLGKYDTIGIDCVAMNVNDLLCVGARPVSMVDYLAIQRLDPDLVDEIVRGLCDGARMANISICGGEMAQLQDIVKGYEDKVGFDLAGTAVGTVALDKIIVGQDIEEGDVVIGIESNGVHSNGLTLARRVFVEQNNIALDKSFPTLDSSLGEELLRPTFIYVREALDILESGITVKAFIHITSDGFLNLTRVASKTGYVIDELPPPPPVFSLIQESGGISDEEMFRVYNMGIGFCIVVPENQAQSVLTIVQSHNKKAHKIGYAIPDVEKRVFIKEHTLVGKGSRFVKAPTNG